MTADTYTPSEPLIARAATFGFTPESLQACAERRPFSTPFLFGMRTHGGTYIVATVGKWNDDGHPRDLLAVLPGGLTADLGGHGPVVALSILVNPDLLALVADTITEAQS